MAVYSQEDGKEMTIVALPLIFQNFHDERKSPSDQVLTELMEIHQQEHRRE